MAKKSTNTKKVFRSSSDRVVLGICGGLGEYFEIDAVILRILFVMLTFAGGSGIFIYIILAFIIPENQHGSKLNASTKAREEKMHQFVSQATDQTKDLIEELKRKKKLKCNSRHGFRNILGLIIVLLGLNLLAKQLFHISLFHWVDFDYVGPTLIMLLGFYVIFKK